MFQTVSRSAMGEMYDWLEERPELPLPLFGAWPLNGQLGEHEQAFHVFARNRADFDRLAQCVDGQTGVFHGRLGARQIFGPVGYEVLLDEARWDPFEDWRVASRPDPLRRQRLAGLRELFAWLEERPELHHRASEGADLGTGLDERGAGDRIRFYAWAADEAEQQRLLKQFDRVEGFPDQRAYLPMTLRFFEGGVCFGVIVED